MSDYWKDNGIEKPQAVVVCAANRKINDDFDGLIITGARHCDLIMIAMARALGTDLQNCEQGFINQFGEFLTREEALTIAIMAGQKILYERNGSSDELFSEGLY